MGSESIFNHVGGIQPAVGEQFRPLSEQQLSKLDQLCEARVTEPFRWFLQNFGAFTTNELVGFKSIEPLSSNNSLDWDGVLSHFFGVFEGDSNHPSSMEWNFVTYKDRIPKSMIPIGTDGGGNMICLGISRGQINKIYFWDHENEWDEDDYLDFGKVVPDNLEFQNISLIANDFEDFASRLMIID